MLIRNLFFLFTITAFAIASLVLDLFNYDPYSSNLSVFINFYVSFFLSVAGIFSFIIYFLKYRVSKDKTINAFFLPSVRQALLISLAITILLLLRMLQILDWWVGGPLVVAIILLELFFQTNSPLKKHKKSEGKL